MRCYNCGYENNDNSKFCNECAATLYDDIDENTKENIEELYQDINKIIEPNIIKATMEENNQVVKKRGKIIILIITICIAIGLTFIGLNLNYSSKVRQADEDMNQKDYDKAVALYNEALNIFNKSDTQSKLSEAKDLQISKEAYDEGMRDYESKGYYSAFLELKNVIEKDTDDYENAIQKQEECKNLYTADKIAEAKKDALDNRYDVAITCLDNILRLDPQNSDVLDLRSQYDLAKKKAQQEADEKAKADAEVKKAEETQKAEQAKQADIAKRKSEGVRIGMTKDEVLASNWGQPKSINKTTSTYGTHEQWVYGGNNYLYFDNGILTSFQN